MPMAERLALEVVAARIVEADAVDKALMGFS
jgi:hypothetical protein